MATLAAVTVATQSYLPWARALAVSLRQNSPNVTLYVCLVDRPDRPLEPAEEPFTVFHADELGIADWPRFAFQYSVLELCCALKPCALRHVWKTTDAPCLLYLDSDIQVFGDLEPLVPEDASVLLTPHLVSPQTNAATVEAETRRAGLYNGGFVAVCRSPEADTFLTWWTDRLTRHCMVDVRAGIFVDQSWLDLVPGYFKNTHILRHPGFNVGYWNLDERPLKKSPEGQLLAADKPLICLHFSGFDPAQPERLSLHGDAPVAAMTHLAELQTDYAAQLKECGWNGNKSNRYGFACLTDGTPIEPAWREAIRQGRLPEAKDPFDTQANPDLVTRLKWEGGEAWPHRLDWRFSEWERICDAEAQWRQNYWRLANSFPVNTLLWLRRRLQGLEDPEPDLQHRSPPPVPHHGLRTGTHGQSETSRCRARLAPYCQGFGVDLGFGGDPILDAAVRVDMPTPYTNVGGYPVQLGGDAARLEWFRDGVLDYVFSSHLLEDFEDTEAVLREWLRVLKPGGRLIIYCPDEQKYRTYCQDNGLSRNQSHKHEDFSLQFVKDVLERLRQTRFIHEDGTVDAYSWELICEKQDLPSGGSRSAC